MQTPAERYATCLECDSFRKGLRQCKECGCFMPVKVRIKSQSCPLGKW